MAEAYGASDMDSRTGEALGLVFQADREGVWASLVLAMAKMERLVFQRVRRGARNGPLQTHDF